MSIGYGAGEDRAKDAVKQALQNPLLDISIEGAKGVLFNIVGGTDLKLEELKIAADEINKLADPGVNMIFGMGTDEKMNSEIRVTIIATGFETNESYIDMNDQSEDIFKILDEEQKYAPVDLPPFLRKYVQNS